ncbi:GNAT family N-acetyltransferase [Microbulbifer guangxiensis]|uniref:GNAT family N-acetyltransferase n=1 Tax=Microbulbifer guangxiensis TaxID=2904249 RepID=UPI001F3614AF|nr:N-acetyltransferase [Microbulbifer guangxiensis]
MSITIRTAGPNEGELIRTIHLDAFEEEEGATVAQLAVDLLQDVTAEPRLVLVAEGAGDPVGCVIFTNVHVEGECSVSASILAPLAVLRRYHGQGIGTALVKEGLNLLQKGGIELVFVLGDPAYYSRFGFRAGHLVKAPHDLAYPEAWMALELKPGVLEQVAGVAGCAAALSAPEHW